MDADAIEAIDDDGDATRATASDARAIDGVVGVIYGVFSSDGGVECVTCAETRAVRDDEMGGGWMFDWDAVAAETRWRRRRGMIYASSGGIERSRGNVMRVVTPRTLERTMR